MRRYLAIWNGEQEPSSLDGIVTNDFVGHIGSRDRDLARLKEDIQAYQRAAPSVRFTIHHQFGEGDFLASRVSAEITDRSGASVSLTGINISRWEDDRLAEEWAVWEELPKA
jgi:pyrimidine operon attenuation protein/uracil phosphoribosyltransferase